MTEARRILVWTILTLLAVFMSYFGFRGYMSADMLFNFANSFYC
jgi:hypothetical protein